MRDYINDTFIRLTQEGRIKDAVAFCECVGKEAPYVELRCVALKNLAECHFFFTGDGEACREANLRGLKLMEDNPEILEGTEHMAKPLATRMYSDFCEQFRAVAVSFEEYEEHELQHLLRGDDASYYGAPVYENVTQTIHHEAEGHYEDRVVQEAYDETIPKAEAWDEEMIKGYRCSECGAVQ